MWEPRRLTTIWASTACYRDSFTISSENKKFHAVSHKPLLLTILTSSHFYYPCLKEWTKLWNLLQNDALSPLPLKINYLSLLPWFFFPTTRHTMRVQHGNMDQGISIQFLQWIRTEFSGQFKMTIGFHPFQLGSSAPTSRPPERSVLIGKQEFSHPYRRNVGGGGRHGGVHDVRGRMMDESWHNVALFRTQLNTQKKRSKHVLGSTVQVFLITR
jgi:hypothetical protein